MYGCMYHQGLARRFVYFNDDVFLSADTWPEDFYTPNGGQKFYPSWGVPHFCSLGVKHGRNRHRKRQ